MKPLKSIQRTLSISYDGLREAVLAVSERVATRVQIGKLHLQALDTEARLRSAYEALGVCLYTARMAPPQEVFSPDNALPLSERVRAELKTLQQIRDQLASRADETLTDPLIRLQEDLKESGGMVERATVSPLSQADGKRLGDLALPEGVRIVAIRRGESLVFPSADSVLKAGDQVTVVGNRSVVPRTLESLRT
ncbi:MAG TPA: TrkA C-terminal domain-containing protein [Nitrospirales bacterium]|nr:TrkA C-terminal domain-containing protein [Nitrospirales bacterium]